MNILSLKGIAKGSFAPKSVGSISANLSNPWAMADAGNRHNSFYSKAMESGGLAAPKNG